MVHRILVVDDDPHIREVICFSLEESGLTTRTACNGIEALKSIASDPPDLVVLDVGMPELDGLEVCRELRKTSDIPILFLSAKDEEIDRILGLEMGGDDYVKKPFSPRELKARLKAILKRSKAKPEAQETNIPLSHGSLEVDPSKHSVSFQGLQVPLTGIELAILKTFLSRPSMVFTREQIMEAAYSANIHVSDRTIDSHIRNIRAKLSVKGCEKIITTVHGVGFRLDTCEPDE